MKRNLFLAFSAVAILTVGCSKTNSDSTIQKDISSEKKEKISSVHKKREKKREVSLISNKKNKIISTSNSATISQVKNSSVVSNVSVKAAEIEALRNKYAEYIKNSPFKKTLQLSKKERKGLGLPPNKFYERQWELSINPATGNTEQSNVLILQKQLADARAKSRTPGDASNNNWIERGPTNVGGRTRVLLFDPNDATNKKVFAGSASGGLWVNNDITVASGWTKATGVPSNLNVSCITVDPNNSNIWYLGTGEQYTYGDALGNGVYKTIDGGATWTNIPVNYTGSDFQYSATSLFVAGVFYVQDIIAWNNAGNTEVFIGVGAHVFGASANPRSWNGMAQTGLYKTTNGGTSWTRNQDANMVSGDFGDGDYYVIPNDLEKDAAGNLWFSTTSSPGFGILGGKIYKSTDGISWTLVTTITDASRTEIEPSTTNPDKFYVLYESDASGEAQILLTNDAFATEPTVVSEPDDVDAGISDTDFTRGQAFYDLMIECDPTNDEIVYIGGIDLFRSTNSGGAWSQISKWSNNNDLAALTCSEVHADQHVMTFRPGNTNQAVFGNDGGVFYASSLSAAETTDVIPSRNTNYNVTQFYSIGVSPTTNGMTGDNFVAGAQDNGSQIFLNAAAGASSSVEATGGDGAYSFFDQDGTDKYSITNYVYNNSIQLFNHATGVSRNINSEGDSLGAFICPMALDSKLDILYSDYSSSATSTYEIRRYSNIRAGILKKAILSDALLTGSPTAMTVSKYTVASTTLLVGCSNGRLLLVTNANAVTPANPTWSNITGPSFVGSISDVAFGQSENDIFVTFHNYGVTSIWYSADKGVTWQNKEGNFANIPVKCILQNPLNLDEVIIGSDLGVWYSNNFNTASPVWKQSYNGMSDVKVLDLQLRNDNTVYAATYGRGVFSGAFTSTTLSVKDQPLKNTSVKIYPNPSSGKVNITSNQFTGKVNLQVVDLTGRIVFNITDDNFNGEKSIDLSHFQKGIYIIKVSNETANYTEKIIIK